jgi:hypothetical protein
MRVFDYTYNEAAVNDQALRELGRRDLPDMKAHNHAGRCIRFLKPHLEEFKLLAQRIQEAHRPETPVDAAEGEQLRVSDVYTDPIGMGQEQANLGRMVIHDDPAAAYAELDKPTADRDWSKIGIELPSPMTEAMMPKPTKTKPDNAIGLGELKANLGPFFVFPDE